VDHCSTFIFINHQLTTSASDTIRGKLLLEREAADVGVSIKGYHTDNGVFSSNEFRSHFLKDWVNLCGLVEWAHTIKTEWLNVLSGLSPTWHVPTCFMRHSTGLIGPSLIFGR
jgi:hypothetical protein